MRFVTPASDRIRPIVHNEKRARMSETLNVSCYALLGSLRKGFRFNAGWWRVRCPEVAAR